jgi:hypothetical protein
MAVIDYHLELKVKVLDDDLKMLEFLLKGLEDPIMDAAAAIQLL